MYLNRRVAVFPTFFFALFALTFSTPTRFAYPALNDAAPNRTTALQQLFNSSSGPEAASRLHNIVLPSRFTNLSAEVTYHTWTWTISTTLSLKLNIGSWVLAPEKILYTLEAAQKIVGKRQAVVFLDKKFTQETGSRINTMIFEVEPEWDDRRLTWADVGAVLGDDGLPKFFKQTREWHSVYFDVIHISKGVIGEGAVRKWYMLEAGGRTERVEVKSE